MTLIKCCVLGCNSVKSYAKNRRRPFSISFFQVPKNPDRFEKWKKALPLKNKELLPKDYVCALHFNEDDIESHFKVTVPDGVWIQKKCKPTLKSFAIPSKFPDAQKYLSSERSEIKLPASRNSATAGEKELKKPEKESRETKAFILLPPFSLLSAPSLPSSAPLFPTSDPSLPSSAPFPDHSLNFSLTPTLPSSDSSILFNSSLPSCAPSLDPSSVRSLDPSSVRSLPSPAPTFPSSNSALPSKKYRVMKTSRSVLKSTKHKRNPSTQPEKENILFEGIYVYPIKQSSPLIDNESEMDYTLSNLQKRLRSGGKTPLSSSIPSVQPSIVKKEDELDSPSSPFHDCLVSESDSLFINSPTMNDELVEDCSQPETTLSESNNVLPKYVVKKKFSFNFLSINVKKVKFINSWWKVNVLDDFISFLRWTPDCSIERKIIVTKDLSVKVFLKDRETTIGKNLEVVSISVISKLIFKVEKIKLCPNIDLRYRNCTGFLKNAQQLKHNACRNCIKWEKEHMKLSDNFVELIKFNLTV